MTEENRWNILNGNMPGNEKGEFTYTRPRGESIIDYVISNQNTLASISKFKVGERVESDHQPIWITINNKREEISRDKNQTKEIVIWSQENISLFRKELEKLTFGEGQIEEEVNYLIREIDNILPRNKIRLKLEKNRNEWWNSECKSKKQQLRRSLRKWKMGIETQEEYRRIRREYKTLCENSRNLKMKEEEEKMRNITNETQVWKYIRQERKKNQKTSNHITTEV
ncbi:hypothetical protein CBL_05029 [Carabus blaptoides fortunei]